MTSQRHSLQRRLLAGVVGLVAAVWLGMAVLTWFDARHELDELLDSHLAQAAALLVAQQLPEVEEEAGGIDTPILHRYAPRVSFQVWHEGRLVLRSTNAPSEPLGRPGHGFESGFRTRRIDGIVWRVFATRGAEHDVQVYVGEQVASRASILMAVLRSVLWPMALALPLLALVGWWGVRRGLAPLRQMGHALAARDPRALQPVQRNRQLRGVLVQTGNSWMSERSGLAAKCCFHSRGVRSATRLAGCSPTRCRTSTR